MRAALKWIGFLAIALQAGSARAAELPEIPFKLQDGLIWVRVEGPNKAKPLNFILDSGAEASVINLRTAGSLHLAMGRPVAVCGINETTMGYWPECLPARMGGVSLPSNYLAMDLSDLSAACHQRVDGLIGAEFFAGRVVQIDFAHEKIRLLEEYSAGADAEVLPLKVEGVRLRVPVEVVGLGTAWARLDTGCASALHWAVTGGAASGEGSQNQLGVGVGVSPILVRQNAKSVRLGGLTLASISTGLHAEKMLEGEAGLLGDGLLSRFSVVTIDEPAGHLALEGLVAPKVLDPHR